MKLPKQLVTLSILGALAVILGAFGAHGLKNKLQSGLITADQLNGFDTAVRYQIYHLLAMFLIINLEKPLVNKLLKTAYRLFFIGILLFSGSLYLLTTRNLLHLDFLIFLGPITPIGGLFFVGGWLCLGFTYLRQNNINTNENN